MGSINKLQGLALVAFLLACQSATTQAETLKDALVEAYHHNPTLNAGRAGLRVTDETVPQALSGWRPTVTATGLVSHSLSYSTGAGNSIYLAPSQESLTIKLDQPVFRGFRTVESTASAESQVKAGRQQLLVTEEQVLLNGVKAYVDVLRDRKIVDYRQRNLNALKTQGNATNERFKAGELTRTDTALANAQIAGAQASLALATANLKSSESNYEQIIGHKPGRLAPAPAAKSPASLQQSYEIAHETNPQILAAAHTTEVYEHQVGVTASGLLPQADLIGNYNLTENQGAGTNQPASQSTLSVEGVVTVPIYEAGLVYSQTRQAKQRVSQGRLNVIDAVRQVRAAVATAWETYVATRQATVSNAASVSASQLAYDGLRQEFNVGSRSTTDVLNAELTLLNAQIAEVTAQHDQLFASYQLQSAIGHLTGYHLHLGIIYDPVENYNRVRNKWIGTDVQTLQ